MLSVKCWVSVWVSVCVYVSCIYVCVCTESRGCRRRCADETAAQRCGSGAPTLVHFSLCQHNAEEVRHILEANISHDTTNDPAHQRHAAFPPACFALPSGTAPRKRTSHQDLANPHGTATSRTYFGRTVCPHTRSKHITWYRQWSHSSATRRVYASMFRAPHWHGATQTHFPPRPRKSQWHCDITNVHGLSTHYLRSLFSYIELT